MKKGITTIMLGLIVVLVIGSLATVYFLKGDTTLFYIPGCDIVSKTTWECSDNNDAFEYPCYDDQCIILVYDCSVDYELDPMNYKYRSTPYSSPTKWTIPSDFAVGYVVRENYDCGVVCDDPCYTSEVMSYKCKDNNIYLCMSDLCWTLTDTCESNEECRVSGGGTSAECYFETTTTTLTTSPTTTTPSGDCKKEGECAYLPGTTPWSWMLCCEEFKTEFDSSCPTGYRCVKTGDTTTTTIPSPNCAKEGERCDYLDQYPGWLYPNLKCCSDLICTFNPHEPTGGTCTKEGDVPVTCAKFDEKCLPDPHELDYTLYPWLICCEDLVCYRTPHSPTGGICTEGEPPDFWWGDGNQTTIGPGLPGLPGFPIQPGLGNWGIIVWSIIIGFVISLVLIWFIPPFRNPWFFLIIMIVVAIVTYVGLSWLYSMVV